MSGNSGFKKIAVIIVLLVIAAVVYLISSGGKKMGNVADNKVVATLNGENIYESDLREGLAILAKGKAIPETTELSEDVKNAAIREIAAQKILLMEARQKGVDDRNEIQERIQKQSDKIVKEALLSETINQSLTEEIILAHYLKATGREGKRLMRRIVLKTEAKAKEVRELLNETPFSEVAKEYSTNKEEAGNGGRVGYLTQEELVEKLSEEELAKLQDNVVSEPIKTKGGWQLVVVYGKNVIDDPEGYKAVRGKILQALSQQLIAQYVDSLLNNANLEIVQ